LNSASKGMVRSPPGAFGKRTSDPSYCEAAPIRRYAWDVYCAAARARWGGRVVAGSVDAVIEAAAVEYNANARKLIAVRRSETVA